MNVFEFSTGTEKLINPMKVGSVHYLQTKMRHLPVWLQRKIVTSAAKKASKMGFVVEPYCFFLVYEINRPENLLPHLPDHFVPAKSAVFTGDTPKYYGITSFFRIHTNVFWGARCEFYAIAENERTGLISWIMMDYLSDTISYDEKSGLKSPNVEYAIHTTTCEGEFIADFKSINEATNKRKCIIKKHSSVTKNNKHINNDSQPEVTTCLHNGGRLICRADLKNHRMRPLDQRLWIDGNTSIAYSREVGGPDGDLFSLTFMPEEMKQAWDIPLKDVKEAKIPWYPEMFGGCLDKAVCFPYTQHMLSDSPGTSTHYGSTAALRKAAESVDFSKIKTL